jgi:hypothetical protein
VKNKNRNFLLALLCMNAMAPCLGMNPDKINYATLTAKIMDANTIQLDDIQLEIEAARSRGALDGNDELTELLNLAEKASVFECARSKHCTKSIQMICQEFEKRAQDGQKMKDDECKMVEEHCIQTYQNCKREHPKTSEVRRACFNEASLRYTGASTSLEKHFTTAIKFAMATLLHTAMESESKRAASLLTAKPTIHARKVKLRKINTELSRLTLCLEAAEKGFVQAEYAHERHVSRLVPKAPDPKDHEAIKQCNEACKDAIVRYTMQLDIQKYIEGNPKAPGTLIDTLLYDDEPQASSLTPVPAANDRAPQSHITITPSLADEAPSVQPSSPAPAQQPQAAQPLHTELPPNSSPTPVLPTPELTLNPVPDLPLHAAPSPSSSTTPLSAPAPESAPSPAAPTVDLPPSSSSSSIATPATPIAPEVAQSNASPLAPQAPARPIPVASPNPIVEQPAWHRFTSSPTSQSTALSSSAAPKRANMQSEKSWTRRNMWWLAPTSITGIGGLAYCTYYWWKNKSK